jgi:hypothetical protein
MWGDEERSEFHARAARRAPKPSYTEDDAFHGKTILSGTPTILIVRFLNDAQLAEAAEYPDDVHTLLGTPVNVKARDEIARRAKEAAS